MKTSFSFRFPGGPSRALALALLLLLSSCSNDDDDTPQIRLGTLSSVYEGACNHSSGFTGADYQISIPYSGTENDRLRRMLISATPEGGNTSEATVNYNGLALNDGSGSLAWNGCLLFLDAAYMDFEVRIETEDGTLSNASEIRLNRTDFDN